MSRFLLRFRSKIAVIMVVVTLIYGSIAVLVSPSEAKTIGVGYIAVMVTIGVLLLACDLSERRQRDIR